MRISESNRILSVLVVEDDADCREAVARYLRKAGYVVRTAENGRDALAAVVNYVPDVIVLDMRMRSWMGWGFYR